MKTYHAIPMLNLQVFADGSAGAGNGEGGTAQGSGVTEADAGSQKGVSNLSEVKYGIQEKAAPAAEVQTETTAAPDRKATFEAMIKGEYKDLYDANVQRIVQGRVKEQSKIVDKYTALAPILEILAGKHGVDANDTAALKKAIEDDDSYFEQEALKRGMTVKDLKAFKKMERENADLRAQMQEAERRENGEKLYASWMQQAEAAKAVYPSFNLEAEISNPKFLDLLRSNIDVRTAYEVVHKDEIIPAAMQFTAQAVESKLAKTIASNGARPSENGMSSQSAAVVKSDVSKLTKYDIDEVARRVARGEKISFG